VLWNGKPKVFEIMFVSHLTWVTTFTHKTLPSYLLLVISASYKSNELPFVENNHILVVPAHMQQHWYVAATNWTSITLVMHRSSALRAVVQKRAWPPN